MTGEKTFANKELVNIISKEVTTLPKNQIVIVATGPLTTKKLSNYLAKILNSNSLHFYDASSPIIDASTIDFNKAYIKDRYDENFNDDSISATECKDAVSDLNGIINKFSL